MSHYHSFSNRMVEHSTFMEQHVTQKTVHQTLRVWTWARPAGTVLWTSVPSHTRRAATGPRGMAVRVRGVTCVSAAAHNWRGSAAPLAASGVPAGLGKCGTCDDCMGRAILFWTRWSFWSRLAGSPAAGCNISPFSTSPTNSRCSVNIFPDPVDIMEVEMSALADIIDISLYLYSILCGHRVVYSTEWLINIHGVDVSWTKNLPILIVAINHKVFILQFPKICCATVTW